MNASKTKSVILALGLLICTLMGTAFQSAPKKIIFFGDSITHYGVQPNGYVTLLQQMLKEKNGGAYEAIGAGISGNKVPDLYLRMDDDVLARKPDAVVIWIGVNDVWAKVKRGTGTDPDKFEAFYNAIIKKLKAQDVTLFLCTPAMIGEKTDMTNEQDGDLNNYAALVRNIAQKNNCTLIDLRKAFLDYDTQHNPENKASGILTRDGVHPNEAGNALAANEIYRVLSQSYLK